MSRWLAEGRTLGLSLGRFHALVVAGSDPDATADVALGIAESQAAQRQVVLGDLSANTSRFGSLIDDDDPHGLVDAFDYGISLGRVARPVIDRPNLTFAPTGSIAPDYAEILAHPRWAKLSSSFGEADQLLLIVLPVGAAGIEDVIRHVEGVVLVDAMVPAKIDPSRVIANVVLKPVAALASQPAPRPQPVAATGAPTAPSRTGSVASRPSMSGRPTGVFKAFAKPAGYGAGLSILAAFIVFWLWNQPFGDNEPRVGAPGPLPIIRTSPPAQAPKTADPNQINPADSGSAAYAVRMMSANTVAGAILKLQEYGSSLPAPTYAPVEKAGRTWYEVLAGAFDTRGSADSLLTDLRSAGRLDSISPGVVVRVPYAVLIDSVPMSATISDLVANLRMRQLPVYALQQRNDWVWIVAGAFETRAQADSFCEQVRASGQPADVVLRKGRMF